MTNQIIHSEGAQFGAVMATPEMAGVEIYHKTWCSFSHSALALLEEKGIAYTDLDVTDDRQLEQELIERSGRTSVPEIFIDCQWIGGFMELVGLDETGELDRLLAIQPAMEKKAA